MVSNKAGLGSAACFTAQVSVVVTLIQPNNYATDVVVQYVETDRGGACGGCCAASEWTCSVGGW